LARRGLSLGMEARDVGKSMPPLDERFYQSIDTLGLCSRAISLLYYQERIRHVGELCQKSESDLLKVENLGPRVLEDIKKTLALVGLSLGMKLEGFKAPAVSGKDAPPLDEKFYLRLERFDFAVRTHNFLERAGIQYVGELCQKTEAELRSTRDFRVKTLKELKEALREMDLSLGMTLDGFKAPSK